MLERIISPPPRSMSDKLKKEKNSYHYAESSNKTSYQNRDGGYDFSEQK